MQNNTGPSVLQLNFNLSSWLKLRVTNISKGQDLILGPYRTRQDTLNSTEYDQPELLVSVVQKESQSLGREQKAK